MIAFLDALIPELLGKNPRGMTFAQIEKASREEFERLKMEQVYTIGFRLTHLEIYLGYHRPESGLPTRPDKSTFNHGRIEYVDGKFFLKPKATCSASRSEK
jgi:hypothetical protein